MSDADGIDANFNNIALYGRSEEIQGGHRFGDEHLRVHLTGGVNPAFLIYPFQQPPAKKRIARIEISGFDNFTGAEGKGHVILIARK